LRIERWVHANMKVTADEALATADHVARTLEGDCTEFAMLTAAMCRAEGVPSRTAIGLIYAEPADAKRAPCFAFHMWTEVWISGRWIPIDATLGKGYVGATHLKITDHSWHDERTMTPIFPVIRVVGRVNIEVLSAENR
jgi:transglutaminase-like putative cysteine protease